MSEESGGGCECVGCAAIIVAFLIFWSMFFGLPIGDNRWNIDIFPPRIWEMNTGAGK